MTTQANENWPHVLAVLASHRFVTGPLLALQCGKPKQWCHNYLGYCAKVGFLRRVTEGRYRLGEQPAVWNQRRSPAVPRDEPMGRCSARSRACFNRAMRGGHGLCWRHRDQHIEEAAE